MGCGASTGTFGPITKLDLANLEERDEDIDILGENEFPYMKARLKEIDWQTIIREGKPWKDPTFPHGKYCLFINHSSPADANKESKKKWSHFTWKRASEYYGKNNFQMFDRVDPSDIIMGSCNNCYMLAALSGIAEAHHDEEHPDEFGERIKDNFLTQQINDAGCYAIQFIIDGQPRTVVVDDYFPFTKTKAGKEIFAFSKPKAGENEIWVQLVEKAWAKLCGSYESSEMGRASEFFENYDGTPTETYWTDDFETDIGQEQLLRIMTRADKNSWVMAGSVLKKMKKFTMEQPKGFLQSVGIKNLHTYTVIDIREVILDSGELEYLLFIRNPAGNFYMKEHEVWKGDWSPLSDKWTPKVRKQVNYFLTEAEIQRARARGMANLKNFNNAKVKRMKRKSPKKRRSKKPEEDAQDQPPEDAPDENDEPVGGDGAPEEDDGDAPDDDEDAPADDQSAEEQKEGGEKDKEEAKAESDAGGPGQDYGAELDEDAAVFHGEEDDEQEQQDEEQPKPKAKKKKVKKKKATEVKEPPSPYKTSNAQGATFWMSLADFCRYFYVLNVSYTNRHYIQSFCQDQVFSYKWGACEFEVSSTCKDCFVSLFQMNDRFMHDTDISQEYDYPEMTLIVTKVIKVPPRTGKNDTELITGECAYIDGTISDLYNTVHVKINKLTAGKYILFYTTKFKKEQLCRKLNTIFYGPIQVEMKRVQAKSFGKDFLEELEARNFKRSCIEGPYKQPFF